jgi:hypothetical protein
VDADVGAGFVAISEIPVQTGGIMAQSDSLAAALLAVEYVKGLMTLGAENKFTDLVASFGQSFLCVMAIRSVDIAVPRDKADGSLQMPAILRGDAAKSADLGCGNCGEQTAVAFMYLKDSGVRPLDYTVSQDPGDHAFVVIGRAQGSDASNYKTWGGDAVVCDPWGDDAFPASDIPSKLYVGLSLKLRPWLGDNKFKFTSLYRLD